MNHLQTPVQGLFEAVAAAAVDAAAALALAVAAAVLFLQGKIWEDAFLATSSPQVKPKTRSSVTFLQEIPPHD